MFIYKYIYEDDDEIYNCSIINAYFALIFISEYIISNPILI